MRGPDQFKHAATAYILIPFTRPEIHRQGELRKRDRGEAERLGEKMTGGGHT